MTTRRTATRIRRALVRAARRTGADEPGRRHGVRHRPLSYVMDITYADDEHQEDAPDRIPHTSAVRRPHAPLAADLFR